jgi:hypothetical protein
MVEVKGISEYTAKMQGINLSGGSTNALEYCTTMFGFPDLPDLLKEFTNT